MYGQVILVAASMRIAAMAFRLRGAIAAFLARSRLAGWIGFSIDTGATLYGIYAALKPEELNEYRVAIAETAVELAADRAGIELDAADPFSDASFCSAIEKKTGVVLRTLKDRTQVREDVERWAFQKLADETGLKIRNIRDREKTKKDVLKWLSPVVADRTGFPLTDISDKEKVKEEMTDYMREQALIMLTEDIEKAKGWIDEAFGALNTTTEKFAAELVKKGGIDPVTGLPNVKINAVMVTLGVITKLLVEADEKRRLVIKGEVKNQRRRVQMAAAQQRFRATHGTRQVYERVA